MTWHYAINDQQLGPVSDEQLEQLLSSGQINSDTLVWREGMADWQPLNAARSAPPPIPPLAPVESALCAECGRSFPVANLIQLNGLSICANCKPIYLQKLSEGVVTASAAGGMWRSGRQLVTVSETPFPDRCVKCNAPANGYRLKRVMYWIHPAYYLLFFVATIVLIIVYLIVRKKAVLYVGLCERHRSLRRQFILFGWLGSLGGLFLAIAGGVAFNSGWPVLFGILMFFGFLLFGVGKAPMVTPAKITRENVWLKGVGPEFMAGLPEWMGR